ncbi:pentatricopeptide repeat-containing protein At4g19191, mitochondrial-like [Prosopis cineraria]|uniref:pentatricopeptide repeat-containing protein At4g19191, mitochondrial-like n=1 Tax=Prosopis cineraria TaxID=364024 RepID=UPI00240FC66F|nr:pentatricopeptide repeat-containing protein At4g19191, mitochondrial-like [Prosopis cineraria]
MHASPDEEDTEARSSQVQINLIAPEFTTNHSALTPFNIPLLPNVLQRFHFFPVSSAFPLLLPIHNLKLRYHYFSASACLPHLLFHSCEDLCSVKKVHAYLIVSDALVSKSVASQLVNLYARFHDLGSVLGIFGTLREEPSTKMWNLVIKSQVNLGLFHAAFLSYKKMRAAEVLHDAFTFPTINLALSATRIDVVFAKMIHCQAIQFGLDMDLYFCNTMIEVYVKCGCVASARNLFDVMSHRDLVSWTSLISGYISERHVSVASDLFNKMRTELEPNSVTLLVMLRACCTSRTLKDGSQIHGYAIKSGLSVDSSVQNAVLGMYANIGNTDCVEIVFCEIHRKDVVSSNILISFHEMQGDITEVACIFKQMHSEEFSWNIQTLTLVLSAIAKSCSLSEGESVHCLVIKTGLSDDILLTSLLDFYAKCGKLKRSVELFRAIQYKSNVAWSAMMSGFIQNGHFMETITLFQHLQATDPDPDPVIWRNLVDAYANLGALKLGKGIHGYLLKNLFNGIEEDIAQLENSILNMYVKSGSISSARAYFDRLSSKDVVAWTTMIEGFGSHGFGYEALNCFILMIEQRVRPNSVTFLSLLSACSHSGLVREGCKIYGSMKWDFGIEPALDHHTCFVDLLGRHGLLKEALSIILKMIILPDSRIWGALLAASRVYGNEKVGEYAAQKLLELEPDNAGYYTLLSNVKASAGRWDEVEGLRRVMSEKNLKRKPGWSCIEVKGVMQGFISGDISHPKTEDIYETLNSLATATPYV